jgi:hypothetical protein
LSFLYLDRHLFAGAIEMSDDFAVAGSDASPTASVLPNSSSSNAPSDVSQQLPQDTVDAWHHAVQLAKAAQNTGWQPVSPNPWPAQAASPSNLQHGGLNFALAPSNAPRSAPSTAQPPVSKAAASQQPEMPNIGVALLQGVWHGGRDLAQTGTALAGGRPDAEGQTSAAAAPLQWADLLSPGSMLAPKLAYQIGQSWPTMAGGIAGTAVGVAAAGGPEDPLSLITGLGGGALGAGMMSGLQSFGNYFGDELQKTPGDPNGAYNRAFDRAKVSGVFSGVAWAAFPARAFQGPLKNMMFQAFGVQPAVNMAHQAADNALTGKPLTEGLGQAYTQGAIGTLPIAGGHYLGNEAGNLASQYELKFDPNTLNMGGLGNVQIVKKAGSFEPSDQPNVVNDGKEGFKLNKKGMNNPEKIEGQPEPRNQVDAAREATAADSIAGYEDVTRVRMGADADTFLNGKPGIARSPDVIAETNDGKYRLGEAKGSSTQHAVDQFQAAGDKLGQDHIKSQDLYCNRLGDGYKADANGFLMDSNGHLARPNGKPVRVHIVPE